MNEAFPFGVNVHFIKRIKRYTNTKNMRNFVRKWGTLVKHDDLMKPQVLPKYDIGFIIKNSNSNILAGLEPWCDNIYVDPKLIESYIEIEKNNR